MSESLDLYDQLPILDNSYTLHADSRAPIHIIAQSLDMDFGPYTPDAEVHLLANGYGEDEESFELAAQELLVEGAMLHVPTTVVRYTADRFSQNGHDEALYDVFHSLPSALRSEGPIHMKGHSRGGVTVVRAGLIIAGEGDAQRIASIRAVESCGTSLAHSLDIGRVILSEIETTLQATYDPQVRKVLLGIGHNIVSRFVWHPKSAGAEVLELPYNKTAKGTVRLQRDYGIVVEIAHGLYDRLCPEGPAKIALNAAGHKAPMKTLEMTHFGGLTGSQLREAYGEWDVLTASKSLELTVA